MTLLTKAKRHCNHDPDEGPLSIDGSALHWPRPTGHSLTLFGDCDIWYLFPDYDIYFGRLVLFRCSIRWHLVFVHLLCYGIPWRCSLVVDTHSLIFDGDILLLISFVPFTFCIVVVTFIHFVVDLVVTTVVTFGISTDPFHCTLYCIVDVVSDICYWLFPNCLHVLPFSLKAFHCCDDDDIVKILLYLTNDICVVIYYFNLFVIDDVKNVTILDCYCYLVLLMSISGDIYSLHWLIICYSIQLTSDAFDSVVVLLVTCW